MSDLPTPGTASGPGVDVGERFAAHVGVRVERPADHDGHARHDSHAGQGDHAPHEGHAEQGGCAEGQMAGLGIDGVCGATATLTGRPPWLPAATATAAGDGTAARDGSATEDGTAAREGTGDESAAPVPTAAVLALVDAVARAAAEAAVTAPGRQVSLVSTAAGVQYLLAASGALRARGSVPCESALADRADERGMVRFSVAVEVLDGEGARVASATVQWVATIRDQPAGH